MVHRIASDVVLLLILSINILTRSSLCLKESTTQRNETSIHETVKVVKQCPDTKNEWIKAAEKKNCASYSKQSNKTFVYHCVINEWANETVEVCAVKILVILGKCTEYNVGGRIIQGSEMKSCNRSTPPCPTVYNSTDAYKYKTCYNLLKNSKQNWSSESNSSQPQLIIQNNPVEAGNGIWKIIFPIALAIVGCVLGIFLLLFVVYRRSTTHPCTDTQAGDSEEDSTLVNHVQNSNLK